MASPSSTRNRIAWILLAIVVVGAAAFASWPRADADTIGGRTTRLAREFRCVDCEGLSVADSQTASARAARIEIRRRLQAGESEAEVRAYFIDLYGESVLLKPQGTGLGLVVWALPVAALILAGAGIVVTVRRGRRTPRLRATDDDEALVARALEGDDGTDA